jgi:hypothetical protein
VENERDYAVSLKRAVNFLVAKTNDEKNHDKSRHRW